MMERGKALTLPLCVDKDNLMDNPLKIPMINLSSEYGKLDRQVSWKTFAGCKLRHCDPLHKNGSTLFERNKSTKITLDMARRKPCLVLTDVLKTEQGKTYMAKMKQSPNLGTKGQSSTWRERGWCEDDPRICRNPWSGQGDATKVKSKSKTPKSHQRSTSPPPQSSILRRKLKMDACKEGKDEHKGIEEVIKGEHKETGCKYSEVVDCGLSVSWEPVENMGGRDELSPVSAKDRWNHPEKEIQHSLKRKRKDTDSQHNSSGSPKRHRASVLRLTGEDGRDGLPGPAHTCLEESGADGDLDSPDRSIVQFTVGGDHNTDILVPIINPNLKAGAPIESHRKSLSSSKDSAITACSPFEPIVLSSDDESSDHPQPCSLSVHTQVTLEDTLLQEAGTKQDDSEVQHVVMAALPRSSAPSPIPSIGNTGTNLLFSTLHCGGFRGKANGDLQMVDQKIIIPLKDPSEQVEMILTFERKALRRYSVWEEQEMDMRGLHFKDDEDPSPAAVLLLCVSETAAAAIQQDLCKLFVDQAGATNTGKASPFILLTLRFPLEGMEGALLRSLLDIDCLSGLTHEQSIAPHCASKFGCWDDIHTPVLCLDESIEFIMLNGLDPHLLCLVGLDSTDPGLNTCQCSSLPEVEEDTQHDLPRVEPDEETVPELETALEPDEGMQLKPKEEQKEQEPKSPPEKRKEKPTPAYTLCHRRTEGSFSVSLCKPDSSWTKYKHQGLAHSLIQFPPPPLKGGITVTMEDLQCLDSGQFLNDVIIDFYLKYLLHHASDGVAERSHIFSSFFYRQLTRRDNASEGGTSDSCQRQRRHQRVKTWTRHVDIFKKDFLFVPVNQESHWYLVVICFPGLEEPSFEAWSGPDSASRHGRKDKSHGQAEAKRSKSPNHKTTATPPTLNQSDNVGKETENTKDESTKDASPGPVKCTEHTFQKKDVCKRPCILIMDSLKLSLHERVFKLLREYLQSEWEVRRGSSRDFGPDQMKSSHCQVPLQDNSSDCGLYLLQYVESFLKDPVVHFDLPLNLQRWFPRKQVRRKRDEIRELILYHYRQQNLGNIR